MENMKAFGTFTFNLKGQVALVTGGARGIGEAVACGLAEAQAQVFIADKSERVFSVEHRIKSRGYKCKAVLADVGDIRDVQMMVRKGIDSYGRIDILVNNAAIVPLRVLVILTNLIGLKQLELI